MTLDYIDLIDLVSDMLAVALFSIDSTKYVFDIGRIVFVVLNIVRFGYFMFKGKQRYSKSVRMSLLSSVIAIIAFSLKWYTD